MSDQRADVIEAAINRHQDGFDRLIDGTGTEDERRRALMDLLVAMWEVGYREGLPRGARALRDAIVSDGGKRNAT